MGLTHLHWKEARAQIRSFLTGEDPRLKTDSRLMASAFVNMNDTEMLLPAQIGDYTDFYSSLDHATNVGIMFRQVAMDSLKIDVLLNILHSEVVRTY
jgi:fumarylacetoacetase